MTGKKKKKNDEQYIWNKPKVVSHNEKLKKRKEKKKKTKWLTKMKR